MRVQNDNKKITRRRPITLNQYIDCGDYFEIILTNRQGAEIARTKIDRGDVEKVKICKWGLSGNLNVQGNINGQNTALHVFLIGKREGFVIDHINTDRLDNRKCNLRYANYSQNGINTNKTRGVTWSKRDKRWVAQIQVNYKHISLGSYMEIGDAILARRDGEKHYFGEFAFKDRREGMVF